VIIASNDAKNTRQKTSNLQYACILIMAFLALPFLPALDGRPTFLTPAAGVAALGVAVLVVAGAMVFICE
jgi:hypothetical protein